MKHLLLAAIAIITTGCVSGPPRLSAEQTANIDKIEIFKKGDDIAIDYQTISKVKAANCSGPGGSRVYGKVDLAMEDLVKKAAYLNADAIIEVSCGGGPFVNNCWAAKVCSGIAVKKK